jgi:hypothetical protein
LHVIKRYIKLKYISVLIVWISFNFLWAWAARVWGYTPLLVYCQNLE